MLIAPYLSRGRGTCSYAEAPTSTLEVFRLLPVESPDFYFDINSSFQVITNKAVSIQTHPTSPRTQTTTYPTQYGARLLVQVFHGAVPSGPPLCRARGDQPRRQDERLP